jgi:hypothetical protein
VSSVPHLLIPIGSTKIAEAVIQAVAVAVIHFRMLVAEENVDQ